MTEPEIHRLPALLLLCGNFDKVTQEITPPTKKLK